MATYTIKDYENFLLHKNKPNGDKLLPSTIERYCEWIDRYLKDLNSLSTTEEYIAFMNKHVAEVKSNVLTSAFINYLLMLNVPEFEHAKLQHASSRAHALKSHRFLQSKVLSRGELRRIFNEVDNTEDQLIFSMLYDTACRRAELMSIKFGDIEFKDPRSERHKDDILHGVWAEAHIIGKGKKGRKVYLGQTSVMLINKIHESRQYKKADKLIELKSPEGLVYATQEHELYKKIVKIGEELLDRHIHPHALRHTKATHMADNGADILDIAAYLGHSHPSTAAIYIEISAFRGKQAFVKYSQDILLDK